MGLDTVELIMSVEDAFGISITDQQASRCETIRQLRDVVYDSLTEGEADRAVILHKIYAIISEQMNINDESLTPDTNFVRDL